MEARLNKKQLLQLLDSIKPPRLDSLSEEEFESVIRTFCANCPDPVKARWLLLDCIDPLSDEELVERALAMPPTT
jgi:hypothetical protein